MQPLPSVTVKTYDPALKPLGLIVLFDVLVQVKLRLLPVYTKPEIEPMVPLHISGLITADEMFKLGPVIPGIVYGIDVELQPNASCTLKI